MGTASARLCATVRAPRRQTQNETILASVASQPHAIDRRARMIDRVLVSTGIAAAVRRSARSSSARPPLVLERVARRRWSMRPPKTFGEQHG
jgi:hypothetical protein